MYANILIVARALVTVAPLQDIDARILVKGPTSAPLTVAPKALFARRS
jgi:hypothetical protein